MTSSVFEEPTVHIGGPLIILLVGRPCIDFPQMASVFYILLIRVTKPESQLVFTLFKFNIH